MIKKNKKIYILFTVFLILITATAVTKVMQNDTFFTIRTGNEILENGYDNLDHLTWHEGLSFYKLRWAFDVLIATIYNIAGFSGIYAFIIIIACVTAVVMFNILINQKNNILISFVATITAILFVAMGWGFTGRAQIISFLLLLIEVFFIEKLINTEKKIYLFLLFLVSVCIVNFHASVWIMTIILILPYLAEGVYNKILNCKNENFQNNKNGKIVLENINIKLLFVAILVIIIGSICSPIGTYTYTYMFKVVGGISSDFINELQVNNLMLNAGLVILLVIFIGILLPTKTKIKLSDLFLFSGLLIMALLAKRNQFFLYLIGTMVVTRLITNFINTYDNENLMDNICAFLEKKSNFIVLILVLSVIPLIQITNRVKEEYIDKTSYPVNAVYYIKENINYEELKIFNGFTFGSYLELCGIQAFMDSRSEIFCEEFNNTTILKDWLNLYEGKEHYEDIFPKYNIDYAIVYNTEILHTYLDKDEKYVKIYEDEYFSIYMKYELAISNKVLVKHN